MSSLRDDIRVVKTARVVVHTLGAWPNRAMSDNHWSIYLTLLSNTSVRLNMRTEKADDIKGTLECSSALGYTLTNSAIKHWDYDVVSGVSVGRIYRLVTDNGRDKYEMSGGGSGCRFWVYVRY